MPPANNASTQPTGPGKTPRPPKRPRSLGWRAFFTTFKWCRISLLLLIFTVIILGLFLDHVGLPDWLERRVEAQFRTNGWEVKFSKLRLRWYRGIVAEGLQMHRTNTLAGPSLFLQTAEFRLNWRALRNRNLAADGVMLKGGRFLWPIPGTNQPPRTLVLEEIAGELLFKPDDIWELKFIEANVLNTHVRFRGDITNASLIRDWKLTGRPSEAPSDPARQWHRLLREAEKVRFTGQPELNVIFSGDASDWRTFDTKLKFTATAVDSPWVTGTNVTLAIDLLPPPHTNDALRIDLKAAAGVTRTRWASATNLDLKLVFEPSFDGIYPTNSLLLLELQGADTPWGKAGHIFTEVRSNPSETNSALKETRADITIDGFAGQDSTARRARINATLSHPPESFLPATAQTAWTFHDLESPVATSQWARVTTKLELPAQDKFRLGATNFAWFERIANLPFNASVTLSNTSISRLQLPFVDLMAHWRFPELTLDSGGQMETDSAKAQISLNTESREVAFQVRGMLDHRRAASFISTNASAWAKSLSFASAPPTNFLQGQFTLPSLTNSTVAWQRDVLPTLKMAGEVRASAGAFREVHFSSATFPFTLTNLHWKIDGTSLAQSNGAVTISGAGDQGTGDFRFGIHSDLDLLTLRPAFEDPAVGRVFDYFEWTTPPRIEAEIRGSFTNTAAIHAAANVTFSNTTFRGQSLDSVTARVVYSNQLVSILTPVVIRKGEWGSADGIAFDLATERLYFTNAVGRMMPRVITRAINPKVDELIAPYVFDTAPDAKTHGVIPLSKADDGEDVRFDVEGGPFHWQRFHLEKVKATLFWRGNTLAITNVTGRWHGADVKGSAFFTFDPRTAGDRFSFHVKVDGADLRKILKDLQPDRTNKTEGRVTGELFITSADTHDWKSWEGYGQARMTNGMLWDIPLFGVFSPIFNTVLPGLGNSRARDATMTYKITNSVIFTKDLEIRATAMRMNYKGTVDFEQKVDGGMEAELLRDFPAFGFLISKVLWPVTKLFAYEITGTLNDPKTKERYFIPQALMAALHPLKTLKDLFNPDDKDGTEPSPKPDERPTTPLNPKSP